jgi:hypothetical protein
MFSSVYNNNLQQLQQKNVAQVRIFTSCGCLDRFLTVVAIATANTAIHILMLKIGYSFASSTPLHMNDSKNHL